LKIGPHLPKLLSNIKWLTFLGHSVLTVSHTHCSYFTLRNEKYSATSQWTKCQKTTAMAFKFAGFKSGRL